MYVVVGSDSFFELASALQYREHLTELSLSAAVGFCVSSQSLYSIHWSDLFATVKIWVVTGLTATSWNWL